MYVCVSEGDVSAYTHEHMSRTVCVCGQVAALHHARPSPSLFCTFAKTHIFSLIYNLLAASRTVRSGKNKAHV